MKDENKFLSCSRDRENWRKKLAIKPEKEEKAKAVFFRPTISDDKRIRELAAMTGETKNAIVEKLVYCALRNKVFTTQKLEEQKIALRRLEDRTEEVADGQIQILAFLEEMRREQTIQEKIISSLLSEIFCMTHTAVSLIRTVLLQLLGINRENAAPTTQMLAAFDETSNLTINRSLQDFEAAAAHHRIKPDIGPSENLFWKSKLKKSSSVTTTE